MELGRATPKSYTMPPSLDEQMRELLELRQLVESAEAKRQMKECLQQPCPDSNFDAR
jgi:hypothetical protein